MQTRESNMQTMVLGYPSFGGAEDQRVKIFSERGFSQGSSLEKIGNCDSMTNIDPGHQVTQNTQITQPDETYDM